MEESLWESSGVIVQMIGALGLSPTRLRHFAVEFMFHASPSGASDVSPSPLFDCIPSHVDESEDLPILCSISVLHSKLCKFSEKYARFWAKMTPTAEQRSPRYLVISSSELSRSLVVVGYLSQDLSVPPIPILKDDSFSVPMLVSNASSLTDSGHLVLVTEFVVVVDTLALPRSSRITPNPQTALFIQCIALSKLHTQHPSTFNRFGAHGSPRQSQDDVVLTQRSALIRKVKRTPKSKRKVLEYFVTPIFGTPAAVLTVSGARRVPFNEHTSSTISVRGFVQARVFELAESNPYATLYELGCLFIFGLGIF